MKYIINNKKLFYLIYKFIDSGLNSDGQMFYNIGYDYNNDEETEDILWFYNLKNSSWEFEYYKPEWYTRIINGKTREIDSTTNYWLPLTPLIRFEDESIFVQRMNNFFGEMWHPVFEKWFEDNFPELPVKTFVYF